MTTPTATPTDKAAEATPRPWRRHDTELDSIVGPDRRAIALVMGRSRSNDEDDANLTLIVKAVNSHDELTAMLRELVAAEDSSSDNFGPNEIDRLENALTKAQALLARLEKGAM